MKETENFSYFKPGVTNVIPLMEVSLGAIHALIRSTRLKEVTEKIRQGTADKTRDLPSACFSGTFKSRGTTGLLQYSSLICLDVDKIDFAPSLKERLSKDTFLNPALIFISPGNYGLKIIIRIKNAEAEKHGLYFDALAYYLKGVHGIEIDASGRDISRLCFICHDPAPFLFEDGFVDSDALLGLIPCRDARPCISAACKNFIKSLNQSHSDAKYRAPADHPGGLLNRMDAVHSLAVDALQRYGWKQKGKLWTRPGKELRQGCSAIYNLYPPEGIHIMTVFSSNAQPFLQNKSYNDCQIICELDYNGDFKKCISDLAERFLKN
jgi:hypothetical protein